MSWPHSRCESLEAALRARISDLEVSLDALREHHDLQMAEAREREQRLADRVLAVRDPVAYSAISANERAAARMPAVQRIGMTPARTSRLPGASAAAATVRRPLLTPAATGFRPVVASPPPSEAPRVPIVAQEVSADLAAELDAGADDVDTTGSTNEAEG